MASVTFEMQFVPGHDTNIKLLDALEYVHRRGWKTVKLDPELPPGKIMAVVTRQVTVVMDGKPGATQATAQYDMQSALEQRGLLQYLTGPIVTKVVNAVRDAPVIIAGKIGEAAGSAASGAVSKAGIPLTVGLIAAGIFTAALVVGVAVVAAKRG